LSIQDLVNIRELQANDLNFILSSSIQSLTSYINSTYKGWNKSNLYQHLEQLILYALNHCNYSIFIACDISDSDHIIGYIVADVTKNHIFLQYTKYAYRKLGIQKHLLLPLVVDTNNPISCNWNTKEMVRFSKEGKVHIQDKFIESLMK
jgi:hypothetical protein